MALQVYFKQLKNSSFLAELRYFKRFQLKICDMVFSRI